MSEPERCHACRSEIPDEPACPHWPLCPECTDVLRCAECERDQEEAGFEQVYDDDRDEMD